MQIQKIIKNIDPLIKRFACPYCKSKSYHRRNLFRHVKTRHPGMTVKVIAIYCSACEDGEDHEVCRKGKVMVQNMKNVLLGKDDQKCRFCHHPTKSQAEMILHFKQKHNGQGVFACASCKYESDWISNLRNHKLSIHEQNIFKCEICLFSSKWKVRFLEHKRENHGIFLRKSKYSDGGHAKSLCDLCGYSAPNARNLKTHNRKQHDGSKVKCDKCKKIFLDKDSMDLHTQTKHSGVRFSCEQCIYTSTTKQVLRSHIKYVHTLGPNSIKCTLCAYKTTFPVNLRSHMKAMHKKDQPMK